MGSGDHAAPDTRTPRLWGSQGVVTAGVQLHGIKFRGRFDMADRGNYCR